LFRLRRVSRRWRRHGRSADGRRGRRLGGGDRSQKALHLWDMLRDLGNVLRYQLGYVNGIQQRIRGCLRGRCVTTGSSCGRLRRRGIFRRAISRHRRPRCQSSAILAAEVEVLVLGLLLTIVAKGSSLRRACLGTIRVGAVFGLLVAVIAQLGGGKGRGNRSHRDTRARVVYCRG